MIPQFEYMTETQHKIWAWVHVRTVRQTVLMPEPDFEMASKIVSWVMNHPSPTTAKDCFDAVMKARRSRDTVDKLILTAHELYAYAMALHPGSHPKKKAKSGSAKKERPTPKKKRGSRKTG